VNALRLTLAALLAGCAPGAQTAPEDLDGPDDCFAALGVPRPAFGAAVTPAEPAPVWCGGRLSPPPPAMTTEPPAPGVCRASTWAGDRLESATTYAYADGRLVATRTTDALGQELARAAIERSDAGAVRAYREWRGGADPAVAAEFREDGRPLRFEAPGARAAFVYDEAGRLRRVEATDRDGTQIEEIDEAGDRAALTTNGKRAETRYDAGSYVTTEGGAETRRFACDRAGHMLWDRGGGHDRVFGYDGDGRLVTVRLANGALGRYAYDDEDRAVRISTPSLQPGAPPEEESRVYDDAGRPLCVQQSQVRIRQKRAAVVRQRTYFEYAPDGALVETRRDDHADGTVDAVFPAPVVRHDAEGRPVERAEGGRRTVYEYDCDR
jgi:YD repeat-containing protein